MRRRSAARSIPAGAVQSPAAHASARHGSLPSQATQHPGGPLWLQRRRFSSQLSTVHAMPSEQTVDEPAAQAPF
jgi:hypothetical protein